jgi:hypothetical protein
VSTWPNSNVVPIGLSSLADALVYRLAYSCAEEDVVRSSIARFTNALEIDQWESLRVYTILSAAIERVRAGDDLRASNLISCAFAHGARTTLRVLPPAAPEQKKSTQRRKAKRSKARRGKRGAS